MGYQIYIVQIGRCGKWFLGRIRYVDLWWLSNSRTSGYGWRSGKKCRPSSRRRSTATEGRCSCCGCAHSVWGAEVALIPNGRGNFERRFRRAALEGCKGT